MLIRFLAAALALNGALISAEPRPQPGTEVQMIVTAADHMNHKPPALNPEDLNIMDATITDWVPLNAGRDLELYFLVDDSANYNFGAKVQELQRFISQQPAPVSIGVAYIRDGVLQVAERPTTDHRRAAAALRAPSGTSAANPYCALSGLIQGWKKTALRREIVLVTSGIDESAGGPAVCVNAEMAIRDAQRAGVVIYALYNPAIDYQSEEWSKADAGLVNLANVAYQTGGEAYFTGHTPSLTIEPFLNDITEHLNHQYLIKLRMASRPEAGLQTIFVTTAAPDIELMKPDKIWIPAAGE